MFLRRKTPLIILVLICANLFFAYEIYRINNLLKTISKITVDYIDDLSYLNNENKGLIDLSTPTFQQIGGASGRNFLISINSIDSHLNGVEVKGYIVNSSSLFHSNSSFQISIDNQSQEFLIQNLNPGYRGYFKVFVPNVNINNIRYGYVVYQNSMVRYY